MEDYLPGSKLLYINLNHNLRHMLDRHTLRRGLLTAILGTTVSLCSMAQSTATFSHFRYEGNDDYYNDNPLTAPGDYFNPVISGWASDPSI